MARRKERVCPNFIHSESRHLKSLPEAWGKVGFGKRSSLQLRGPACLLTARGLWRDKHSTATVGWEVGKEWMAWELGFTSKCLPTHTAQRRDGVRGPATDACCLNVVSPLWWFLECHQTNLATGGQTALMIVVSLQCMPSSQTRCPCSSPDRKAVTSVLIVHVM